jgi:hypothetical protein
VLYANVSAEAGFTAALQAAGANVKLDVAFNPDAFTPFTLDASPEDIAADENAIRELAKFLTDLVIPSLVDDLEGGRISLVDGTALTDAFHMRGIGMRYLGMFAKKAKAAHVVTLATMEMISRAAKHVFRRYIRQGQLSIVHSHALVPFDWVAAASAHFLNCLLVCT